MMGTAKGQEGAALVEFALVLPLFLALLFGVVEFALIMHTKGIIAQGSQVGARSGAVYRTPPVTPAEIQAEVVAYLRELGLTDIAPGNITVTPDPGGATISVRVDYTYHLAVLPQFLDTILELQLSAETVSRLE